MKPLSAHELLTVWDENSGQPLLAKTLRLLAKASEVADEQTVGNLSIGERDARLLLLREWLFGSILKNKADCPACREVVEWETATSDLRLQPIRPDFSVPVFTLEEAELLIRFRLPNTYDVMRALENRAYRMDEKKILTDCILEIRQNGEAKPVDFLTEEVIQTLEQRMSEEDPQADIRMKLGCPACQHTWEVQFDIVSFLWAEINNWSYRIMDEVALLARNFGWSEKDIVNMSARRRYLYSQMLER